MKKIFISLFCVLLLTGCNSTRPSTGGYGAPEGAFLEQGIEEEQQAKEDEREYKEECYSQGFEDGYKYCKNEDDFSDITDFDK